MRCQREAGCHITENTESERATLQENGATVVEDVGAWEYRSRTAADAGAYGRCASQQRVEQPANLTAPASRQWHHGEWCNKVYQTTSAVILTQ